MRRGLRARLRGKWLLVIVGAICVGALTLEAILLSGPPSAASPGTTGWPTSSNVEVLDVDLIPTYDSPARNDTGYLVLTDCGCGPVNVTPDGVFTWWVRVGNTGAVNHTLSRATIDAPFSLTLTSPETPVTVAPGSTVNVTLDIRVPSVTGGYIVTGALWTE